MKSVSKRTKYIIAALVLLALFFFIGKGCKKDTTTKVSTTKAVNRTIVETVDEAGKVYPINEVKVSTDAGSLIETIYVQEGDTVRQGQLIAVTKTDQTSMVAARSGGGMQNLQKAMSAGMMNPAALAQAMQQNQPAAPTMKRETKVTNVYAPMNGVITSLSVKKGERLMGTEIARVASINEWEVRADIGEIDIVKIKEGNIVKINIEALGDTELDGTVYRITNNNASGMGNLPSGIMADITSYKVFIKISGTALSNLKNNAKGRSYHLRMGMNATIKIETATKANVLTIPMKAVTTRYKDEAKNNTEETTPTKQKPETVVFIYENGVVKKKVVSTGLQDIDYIEIISGLTTTETIVVEPFEAIDKTLKDGQKVKVVDSKEIFK
jgi:HlyD family secretion protein